MTDSNDYRLISADAHVLEPPDLFERLPGTCGPCAQARVSWTAATPGWSTGASPSPCPSRPQRARATGLQPQPPEGKPLGFDDVLPGLYDPAERLTAQDADSVQAEVLYPIRGLWDAITAAGRPGAQVGCAHGPTTTGSPSSAPTAPIDSSGWPRSPRRRARTPGTNCCAV